MHKEPDQCFHCSLPIPAGERVTAEVDGSERNFCCHGCKAVCETIFAAGLDGFYRRTPEGTQLAPPPEPPKDLALYDIDEVQSEFVDSLGEQRDIHLLVEGIHCAACIWLIEQTLHSMPGVLEARANLSARRLHVKWDNSVIKLSRILQRLSEIGYAAVPYDPETAEGSLNRSNRQLLYRMAFAGFAMMNLLWISIALYSGADKGEFRTMFHWVGFALATPTLLYSGWPFFRGAWSGLRNFHLGMDLPIAIGAAITYLYSLYVTLSGDPAGEVYYDTVVNFLFVILVGRYLEAISKRQAVASTQRLLDLQPRVATVIRDAEEHIVPIRTVKIGEQVLVKPGERIPVDGVVIQGSSSVDEAMLSGESQPLSKRPGDQLSAGTINIQGVLHLRVESLLKDTALGRIIRLVEDAQASKAPIQCVADQIVPWFVAVTLGVAMATFFFWLQTDFDRALMAATAVLIITCPCAFGLATPMAIAVASGLGARHGILVRNGEVLERFSAIDHIVFDKTGTLTKGVMSVAAVYMNDSKWSAGEEMPAAIKQLLSRVAAVERYSEHPLAAAILEAAAGSRLDIDKGSFINQPGFGVGGIVSDQQLYAGTTAWMESNGVESAPSLQKITAQLDRQGASSLRIAVDGSEVALIAVEDPLREDAQALITRLKHDGIRVTLLSGDRRRTAEVIAQRLGGGMEVIADVLPEEKDRVIAQLQSDGELVAMVGDGVNDAPALVRADVGIALGSGTDVSIASADIVLMSNELEKVALASALSRRTLRTIRQNIGISIAYNIIMVPLAVAALVTPLVAAVSMPVSSLLVIGNAARIRTLFRNH
ncbi:MAG: heavy metal translocating P-type ATPase [Gammaproteobacteria bacterium]|nr:heavy metal translocating P-type ATPase [Gammaproteobacteria bacterium]